MTYQTVMVHLELGHANAGLLQVARDLAVRFGSRVMGVVACQPTPIFYGDGGFVSADLIADDRRSIEGEQAVALAEFTAAMAGAAATEWVPTVTFQPLAETLAAQARAADLVVMANVNESASRRVNTGDFIMQVGRPVLVVPPAITGLALDRVVLGWKDTRETRRAASDAMPLLQAATDVCVFEVATQDDLADARTRLDGVAAWLRQHGVTARTLVTPAGDDEASGLRAMTADADIVIGGAYGHSRLREWVLGGATRDLLLHGKSCALVSH